MTQEDDHRSPSGETPQAPADGGSPVSGAQEGAGSAESWAAPGGADTPGGGAPAGFAAPGSGEPAGRTAQDHQAPQVPQAPGYGPQAPGAAAPGFAAPGYGPPQGQGQWQTGPQPGPQSGPNTGQWQAAQWQAAPGQYPQGQYPQQPGYGHPGYRQIPQAAKPGVVALRPMTLGDILNGAFTLIRRNPKTMVGLSLIIMAVASIVTAAASTWYTDGYIDWLDQSLMDPYAVDPDVPIFPGSPLAFGLTMVGELIGYLGGSILVGLLATTVGMAVLGYRLTPAQAWAGAKSRFGAVIGLALIQLVIMTVLWTAFMVVVFGAIFLGALAGVASNVWAGLLVGAVSFIGGLAVVFAPFLWIWIRLYYALPIVVLERLGPFQAMARSWRLSQGHWWRTFGVWALTGVLLFFVSSILATPLGIASGVFTFIDPEAGWTLVAAGAVTYLGTVIAAAITQPFRVGVNTLLYVDLRMRREGLDLKLHTAALSGQEVGPEIYLPEQRA
ncbi:glycerophosphoryl diester phosphodiesterase membrane domain-containing protein [Nocardiopsis protaetiae]|uniref:glycerophosphoryl diester phosphodiesterase membrane domain-containing protein n=1 Tax=Nocardiopsis protaetiae TaxID=3382270 RepID=UPI00387A913A